MPSLYGLKPLFQKELQPIVAGLAGANITANQVTLCACVLSVATGVWLSVDGANHRILLVLPVILFVRMAMNAIDGMLAREFGQASDAGAYLNELTDLISDCFLYMPFAFLGVFNPVWIAGIIGLAMVSEMAGVLGVAIGGKRRYDGPMGKSDRALVFGAMAIWIGFGGELNLWVSRFFVTVVAALLAMTIVNRVRNGLRNARS